MSFIIDPPLLIISGLLIFFIGERLLWKRIAKIAVGFGVAATFIIVSVLLYLDEIKCTIFVCGGLSSSEFMFHTDLTGIAKSDVPVSFVVFLFLLYPFWITAGYSIGLKYRKWRDCLGKKVPSRAYTLKDVKSKKDRPVNTYVALRGGDTRELVKKAVAGLGKIENFVKEGDTVLIKINVCGGVPGKEGSYTGKDVVEVVVDMVRDAGGKPILADADMVWTNFWPAATDIGWDRWVKEYNESHRGEKSEVDLVNLSETEIVNFNFGGDADKDLQSEHVSKLLIDADCIISIPAMKTHALTDVTLGMKNMYGTFPEIDKAKYHLIGIDNVIYWMNRAFTPNLTIVDGSIGGEATGPLHCVPVNFQTIIASDDVVMADSIASRLMGFDPLDEELGITHIKIAHEKNLGDASKTINITDFQKEYYPHFKDGNWSRPYGKVTHFYDRLVNMMLHVPAMPFFFSLISDFFAYDLVKMPIVGNLIVALLTAVNDFLRYLDGLFPSAGKEKMNSSLILVVFFVVLFGFYKEGFMAKSNFFYNLNFLLSAVVSIVIGAKMKTKYLAALLVSTIFIGSIVEYIGTSTDHWIYTIEPATGKSIPPIFAVVGWSFVIIPILGLSVILKDLIHKIEVFKGFDRPALSAALPLLVLLIVAYFLNGEGEIYSKLSALYIGMALLGLIYAGRHSIEWTVSLVVVGILIGGYMEFIGYRAGMFEYPLTGDFLPLFLSVAWALNILTVLTPGYLLRIDMEKAFK